MHKVSLAALFAICASAAAHADDHRQLGAHVHGTGKLNIALENKTLSVELEVPGADITGFEHEATSAEDKAKLEKAKATLEKGLELFTPTSAASCSQKNATVKVEAHEHHEEGEDHDDDHDAKGGHDEHGEGEHHHSEFHVEYVFECAAPAKISNLTFGYFKHFPNAQELDVAIITPKGQSSYEVKRADPKLDLKGTM